MTEAGLAQLGVTVNDVLGGVLNMTIQRYLRETEPEVSSLGRSLRCARLSGVVSVSVSVSPPELTHA
eukprot:1695933-Rhodomonas_salina.1